MVVNVSDVRDRACHHAILRHLCCREGRARELQRVAPARA
jgi:hypothetical protein